MNKKLGLGKLERERLTKLLRNTKGTIMVKDAACILSTTQSKAAKMLARWAKKGWLLRVQRGLYVPVPLESVTADIAIEDPWVIAARLFAPCYIGGWSAAEYWDLTEQLYRTTLVVTARVIRKRNTVISGTNFLLRTIAEEKIFGTKNVWRGQAKVLVSDPSRTIIDIIYDPQLGGGLRPIIDMLNNYLNSNRKQVDLLMEYARRLNNGAVFKRLGFLLEQYAPQEKEAINFCTSSMTKGNALLDPSLEKYQLVSRWRLWLPKSWKIDKGSIQE
jgi:predicted transcriptional regulator of viral defense system